MQATVSDVNSVNVENASPNDSLTKPCTQCTLPMSGLFVRALGGFYHIECFKCLDCGDVVASKYVSITGQDGKQHPLCEKDYYRRLKHVCHSCNKFIQGPFITACGKKYHVDHFTCSECRTVFGKNDSYYEHDGRVLCHYHYSLIAAAKCTGCQVPIISRFVESKKNELNERWHPECYMINKFWNVKLGPPPALSDGNDKSMTNEELQKEQNRSLVKAQHIWSILSAFEESSASCISEMLIQVSNSNYKEGIKMAEKFTMHVEILFTAIDRIQNHMIMNNDSLGFQQEPRQLCRKIIGFFSLLSHTKEYVKNPIGITQDLLSQVTGVAHYLKNLIRVALLGAIKLERTYETKSAVSNFLKMLVVHSDKEKAMQWRMLAKMEADIASELCTQCSETIEEECYRYGKHRWHPNCLKCQKCEANPTLENYEEFTFNQLKTQAFCPNCSTGSEFGFKKISKLDQYSFLLRLSLRRLYTLLNKNIHDDSALPAHKLNERFARENRSSPSFNLKNQVILQNAQRFKSPERIESNGDDVLGDHDILVNGKQSRRISGRQRRTASNATSIHNLSMIVHSRKTLDTTMERQRSEGTTIKTPISELTKSHQSTDSLPLTRSNSTPSNSTKPKSFLCELSELEFFIVQHLSALSLAPLLMKYISLEELLEMVGPRKSSLWSRFKSSLRPKEKKSEGTFGVNLETLTKTTGVDSHHGSSGILRMPEFVDRILCVLRDMDMSIEGIFRKNGNIRRLKELSEMIDRDLNAVDLSKDNPVQIAALLKKFLRDLPDPLISFKLHRLFVISQKLDDYEARKKVLHLSCCLLPRANRDVLEALFVFLKWVSEFAVVDETHGSKMDLENLATVITPNILYGNSKDPTKDESFLAISAVTDMLSMQNDFWEVPESVSNILQEVDLIEDGVELSAEEILRRCENYLKYRETHPSNPSVQRYAK
ncbi:RhoGAP-domain-containing protein [Neoconidiobolus thromboides FSU 785]|nr:RhoGAP-domain-containing protein [Neoconidiobolus thromboides FSU 785]